VILEDLASHGYAVVGVDHPYLGEIAMADGSVTPPDDSQFASGREASDWYSTDLMFVIDRLQDEKASGAEWARRLDLRSIATVGHSSGGSAAVAAAACDDRVKAVSSFDAGVQRTAAERGVPQPVMLFRAERGSYTSVLERPDGAHEKGTIYGAEFFRDRTAPFYEVVVSGTTHGSFGDYGTMFGEDAECAVRLGQRRTVARYLVAFLDEHLRGRDTELLAAAHADDVAELRLH
jgi:pimeloyl-ACP methyl ester carboxylesterase